MAIQNDIARAREARSKALNQMANLAAKGKTNDPIYLSLQQDADNYSADIDALLKIEGNTTEEERNAYAREAAREAEETRRALAQLPGKIVSSIANANTDQRRKHFELFKRSLLTPHHKFTELERRDLTTLETPGGQDLISQAYSNAIQSASRTYGPIASSVNIVDQKYVKLPNIDATGINYLVLGSGEGSTVVAEPASDGSNAFSQTPSMWSSANRVNSIVATVNTSRQLFEDSESLEEFLTSTVFAESLIAGVEAVLTTGKDIAGTVLPSATSGLLANSATGATTSTLTAGIKYGDFISLFESLTYAYINPDNPDARIFLHPSTKLYLQGQVDGAGRPFYSLDAQGNLVSIAGVKVAINNALPAYNAASPVAGQVVAVAGNAKKSINYVQGGSTLTLVSERFIDKNVLSFVSEHRIGVTAGVAGATKALVLAAS